jgi:tetratricopeptide (TPR) repeat protein
MEPSESLYNELLSGNPSQGTLFKILYMMKKEGMLERVIDECTKALETYPDDIKIRRLLAEACFRAGMISRAESEIRSVIDGINELMASYRFQADLFISQGRNADAVESLKLYLIHCPDDKESYALLESLLPREEAAAETLQTQEEAAKEKDRLMRKKKMVSILESWLEGIHEQSKPGLSIV